MPKIAYTDGFKRDAVALVGLFGHPVGVRRAG